MTDFEAAKKFIETYVDYIDDDRWFGFFDSMWEDYPTHINHEIASIVLNELKSAGISWNEDERVTALFQGINSVLNNAYSAGETVYIYDLYNYDKDQWLNGASHWLGYSAQEFYELIAQHPEKLKAGVLYGSLIGVNT